MPAFQFYEIRRHQAAMESPLRLCVRTLSFHCFIIVSEAGTPRVFASLDVKNGWESKGLSSCKQA